MLGEYLAGGTSSPGRWFDEVDCGKQWALKGSGSRLMLTDGIWYDDYMCGLGPVILGHGHESFLRSLRRIAESSSIHGVNSVDEHLLSELIITQSPGMEVLRFACSGTEANITALRLSRVFTGKTKVIKFKGGYHGHSEETLTPAPEYDPRSSYFSNNLLQLTYNDVQALIDLPDNVVRDIAAIIIEPLACNMGLAQPSAEFIGALNELRANSGAIIISDEVVTGFRFKYGPIYADIGLNADLCTYGKIIGGGWPIGAVAGRRDIMNAVVTIPSYFQGGTFAGCAGAMISGFECLDFIKNNQVYEKLDNLGARIVSHVNGSGRECSDHVHAYHHGGLFCFSMNMKQEPLRDHIDADHQDRDAYRFLHSKCLNRGIILPGTIEEPGFLSFAHDEAAIDRLGSVVVEAISEYFMGRDG